MDTHDTALAKTRVRGPISQILHPVRGRLIVASMLAAAGAILTLVPLAGIAHIGKMALGGNELARHRCGGR